MSIPAAFALMGSNPEEACRFERIPTPIHHVKLNNCALTWIDER